MGRKQNAGGSGQGRCQLEKQSGSDRIENFALDDIGSTQGVDGVDANPAGELDVVDVYSPSCIPAIAAGMADAWQETREVPDALWSLRCASH